MKNNTRFLIFAFFILSAAFAGCSKKPDPGSKGPLTVHPDNPRYFTDADGRAVFVTGSHTWANFQERGVEGETPDFDYPRYLDFLHDFGHNFIRLWVWEHAQWMQFVSRETPVRYEPNPYMRTGPGQALDGGLRFDLTKFNPEYFERLRQRVDTAGQRGFYMSVMLFQGFSLSKTGGREQAGNAWHGHPFHLRNNINGIDGNPSGDDAGHEVHTLQVPEITQLQKRYLAKVLDILNDCGNVLYEISNESQSGSVEWQYEMIRFIKEYESNKPQQHLVGMTGAPIRNAELFASPADWISPVGKEYLEDPPAASGEKIVVVDTDHISPWSHDPVHVWKNFFRGNHFILMDSYMDFRMQSPAEPDSSYDDVRRAMGHARRLSERYDLAALVPEPSFSTTRYVLAGAGMLLIYQPGSGDFEVRIEQENEYRLTWIDPVTWEMTAAGGRDLERGSSAFTPPQPGAVILVLEKQ